MKKRVNYMESLVFGNTVEHDKLDSGETILLIAWMHCICVLSLHCIALHYFGLLMC
jgi:hypothetical protein